jgi:hypothetical protein
MPDVAIRAEQLSKKYADRTAVGHCPGGQPHNRR